jgi:hypothetical protein
MCEVPKKRLVPKGTAADVGKVVGYDENGYPTKLPMGSGDVFSIQILADEVHIVALSKGVRYLNTHAVTSYTITIDTDATLNLPIGFRFEVSRIGGGLIMVNNAVGVTIVGDNAGYQISPGLNRVGSFVKVAANTWFYTETTGKDSQFVLIIANTLLDASHAGKILEVNAPADVTITMPVMHQGYQVGFRQTGAGKIVFAAGVGLTIGNFYGYTKSGGLYSAQYLEQINAGIAILSGELSA